MVRSLQQVLHVATVPADLPIDLRNCGSVSFIELPNTLCLNTHLIWQWHILQEPGVGHPYFPIFSKQLFQCKHKSMPLLERWFKSRRYGMLLVLPTARFSNSLRRGSFLLQVVVFFFNGGNFNTKFSSFIRREWRCAFVATSLRNSLAWCHCSYIPRLVRFCQVGRCSCKVI